MASEFGRRGKELNLLPLPCCGSALPMSYAPLRNPDCTSAAKSFYEPPCEFADGSQNNGCPFADEFFSPTGMPPSDSNEGLF